MYANQRKRPFVVILAAFIFYLLFQMLLNAATKAKNGKRPRRGRGGGLLFTDRESAMRHMRFQGHIRAPSKKGRKTGNPGLDTGWSHKNAKVFDEK